MAIITPDDLYDGENLSEDDYPESHVLSRIAFVEELFERITHKFFEPTEMPVYLDGNGTDTICLPMPLVTFTSLSYRNSGGTFTAVQLSSLHNYNGYFDRGDPRISIIEPISIEFTPDLFTFPVGKANILIQGEWAYLNKSGQTPEDIKQACKLLVYDYLPVMDDNLLRESLERRNLAEEETDGHRWESHEKISGGKFTGNKEVDQILARYIPSGDCHLVGPVNSPHEHRKNKR